MEFDKVFKTKKGILIAGLIIIAIGIGLIVASIVIENKSFDGVQMREYNYLISKNEDEENQLVKLVITKLPYQFATAEEGSSKLDFYFAFDENNYSYIVRLSNDTYEKMREQYDADKENFKYVLKGYIYNTPIEIKNIAISTFNEQLPDDYEKVTLSNFRSYLGNTYLDEKITPNSDTCAAFTVIGIGSIMLSVIFLSVYFSQLIKIKSTLKKYDIDDLKQELNNADTITFEKEDLYLTNKHIISTVNGLDVFKYEDILWIYNEKRKQNGILIGICLIAYTTKNKRKQIANSKKEDILIEIMGKIKEKNQNVLVGFTPENRKTYKDLLKNN